MPPEADWERHKSDIHRLYMQESKSLSDVISLMKRDGLIATKNQYQTKLKAWGFSKRPPKLHKDDWQKLGYLYESRKREGKETDICLDGNLINTKRLKREFSRHYFSTTKRVALDSRGCALSPLTPRLALSTPPASDHVFEPIYQMPWQQLFAEKLAIFNYPPGLKWTISLVNNESMTKSICVSHPFSQQNTGKLVRRDGYESTVRLQFSGPILDRLAATWLSPRIQQILHGTLDITALIPHEMLLGQYPDGTRETMTSTSDSRHFLPAFVVYILSNNLTDCYGPVIWELVKDSAKQGFKLNAQSKQISARAIKAAMQNIFREAILYGDPEVLSWVLDNEINPEKKIVIEYPIFSQDLRGRHLPLVGLISEFRYVRHIFTIAAKTAGEDPHITRRRKNALRVLLTSRASVFTFCCEEHLTAMHFVIMARLNPAICATVLEHVEGRQLFGYGINPPESVWGLSDGYLDDPWSTLYSDAVAIHETIIGNLMDCLLASTLPSIYTNVWLDSPETMIQAVEAGNPATLRAFHARGYALDCHVDGYSTLMAANWNVECLETLLELGVPANFRPEKSLSPLRYLLEIAPELYHISGSIEWGQLEVAQAAEILLRYGADVHEKYEYDSQEWDDDRDWFGYGGKKAQSLLDLVRSHDGYGVNIPLLECFCKFGVQLSGSDIVRLYRALIIQSEHDEDVPWFFDVLSAYISGASGMAFDSDSGKSLLLLAVTTRSSKWVTLLVDAGAEVEWATVWEACRSGNYRTAVYLAEKTQDEGKIADTSQFLQLRRYIAARTGRMDQLKDSDRLFEDVQERNRVASAGFWIYAINCGTDKDISRALHMWPCLYNPILLYQVIDRLEKDPSSWRFVDEILSRRTAASLKTHHDPHKTKHNFFTVADEWKVFDRAVVCAKKRDDFRLLEYFHQNQQALEKNAPLNASWIIPRERWCEHLDLIIENCGPKQFESFLKSGFQPDCVNLLIAAKCDQADHVELILRSGLHPDTRFSWSNTSLQLAVRSNNLRLVQLLLQHDADVNQPVPGWVESASRQYYTRLYRSHKRNHSRPTEINVYDNINVYNNHRDALQSAVENGDMQMVRLLLNHGADVNGSPAYFRGATALQIACIKGYMGIVQMLISKGADIYAEGAKVKGRKALVGAAEHGRLDVVRLLLETGVLFTTRYRNHLVEAIAKAEAQGHSVVTDELRKHHSWGLDDDQVGKDDNDDDSGIPWGSHYWILDDSDEICLSSADVSARIPLDGMTENCGQNSPPGGSESELVNDGSSSLCEQYNASLQIMPYDPNLGLSEAARLLSDHEIRAVADFAFGPRSELQNYVEWENREDNKGDEDKDEDFQAICPTLFYLFD